MIYSILSLKCGRVKYSREGRLETGVCRWAKPLCWGFGGIPNLEFPQDWGIEGVERAFVSVL